MIQLCLTNVCKRKLTETSCSSTVLINNTWTTRPDKVWRYYWTADIRWRNVAWPTIIIQVPPFANSCFNTSVQMKPMFFLYCWQILCNKHWVWFLYKVYFVIRFATNVSRNIEGNIYRNHILRSVTANQCKDSEIVCLV